MGIMPLAYDTRKWWSYEGVFGIGMRPCSILDDIVRVGPAPSFLHFVFVLELNSRVLI